jgi:bacteriocin-like protein
MVDKDWKLSTADLDVLATDKPVMDKISETVELTEEELALISGGEENHGYWHRHYWWHHHYWWHRHWWHHHRYW